MESKRQKQMGKLLHKDLSEIFLRYSGRWKSAMVNITSVRMSPDLGVAKLYLSIFALNDLNREEILHLVEDSAKEMKQELVKRIKNQVRMIPELRFYIDDTQDHVQHIEQIFNTIDIPEESDSEEDDDVYTR